jgi:cell division protein ZapA (FtsZ GTPase activity inhibitor)
MAGKPYEVTIRLMGKTLPVMVAGEAEEANLRLAVRGIEDKIAAYRKNFAMHDDGYLLIMCCLELATELQQLRYDADKAFADMAVGLTGKLQALNRQLDKTLAAALN